MLLTILILVAVAMVLWHVGVAIKPTPGRPVCGLCKAAFRAKAQLEVIDDIEFIVCPQCKASIAKRRSDEALAGVFGDASPPRRG